MITDMKLPSGSAFLPDATTRNYYYPFGMERPGMTAAAGGDYRFGYNGKEKMDDIYGKGNALDFGARILDTRVGRWFSRDPLASKYPEATPYGFALNTPIRAMDPDGKVVVFINGNFTKAGEGGSSSYWNLTESTTQYFERNGINPKGPYQDYQITLKSMDKPIMSHYDDWNAIYRSGAGIGFAPINIIQLSTEHRLEAGLKQGAQDAHGIVTDLMNRSAKDENGNYIETIKVVSHSMGGKYTEGYIEALQQYIKDNNLVGRVRIEADIRLGSYQSSSQKAVGGVPLLQFSNEHDELGAGDVEISRSTIFKTNSDPNKGHSVFDFDWIIGELPDPGIAPPLKSQTSETNSSVVPQKQSGVLYWQNLNNKESSSPQKNVSKKKP